MKFLNTRNCTNYSFKKLTLDIPTIMMKVKELLEEFKDSIIEQHLKKNSITYKVKHPYQYNRSDNSQVEHLWNHSYLTLGWYTMEISQSTKNP